MSADKKQSLTWHAMEWNEMEWKENFSMEYGIVKV